MSALMLIMRSADSYDYSVRPVIKPMSHPSISISKRHITIGLAGLVVCSASASVFWLPSGGVTSMQSKRTLTGQSAMGDWTTDTPGSGGRSRLQTCRNRIQRSRPTTVLGWWSVQRELGPKCRQALKSRSSLLVWIIRAKSSPLRTATSLLPRAGPGACVFCEVEPLIISQR